MHLQNEASLKSTAQANFSRWNQALLTKNPANVTELYDAAATFLPTLSPEFKKGWQGTKEYFQHFLEKNPAGAIIEEEVQLISPDSYLHSGLYNFTVGPENVRETVAARFTFVWKKDQHDFWKIIHHHSSIKPRA